MSNLSCLVKIVLAASMTTLIPFGSARASCNWMVNAIELKMNEYREFRQRNQAQRDRLISTETRCKTEGNVITGKALKIAESLSCQAQKDASALNEEISALGRSCEDVFREIKVLQIQLQANFVPVHDDVKEGLELMAADPLMKKYCPNELEVATTMGTAFLGLESGIAGNMSHSETGERDYFKLKDVGRTLAAQTAAHSANCGESAPAPGNVQPNRMLATTYGQGAATVTPIGESPRPVSDISGTQKAIDDNARAEALISK